MSNQDTEGQPRWWRRSRDLALRAARESRATAAETMFDLDSQHKDLPALMSAHADGQGMWTHRGRATASDPVTHEWAGLSQRVDAAIGAFLDLDASFNRDTDYEEPEANRFAAAFAESAQKMRAVLPDVERFRARHEDALLAAYNRTLQVPRAIDDAAALLASAQQAYAQVQAQGLTDTGAAASYRDAVTKLDAAKAALSRKEWSNAAREADAAKSIAREVTTRLSGLPKQAQDVRNGFLSVRTRRDALHTQHDRLGPVMSELRRKYTFGSWKHIDDAPQRIDAAMETVDAGLRSLEAALATTPMDVPAAATLLKQVRAAASDVDSILRSALDTLHRLDEVSANPETLLTQVRRKTLDARRFLSALPPEKAQRFHYTFDNLAARTDRLLATTRERHPDWGAVIAEAKSIEDGLDAMIRTARTS